MRCYLLAAFVFILSLAGVACAGTTIPPNWPWRGVTVSSSDSSPEDIQVLKSRLPYNSIRLTIDARFYAKIKGVTVEQAWAESIAWGDAMLDACKSAGVTAVLSISQFPLDPSLGLTQESPEFWNDPSNLDEVIYRVGLLAEHFSARGTELGGYEILNEPVINDGGHMSLPPQWSGLMKRIVHEIRLYDPGRWIVVTPGVGGMPEGYKGFVPLEDNHIIYGTHMYNPHAFTWQGIGSRSLGYTYPGRIRLKFWDSAALVDTLSSLREFQKKYNVPVWIGEFSAVRWAPGSDKYLLDLVKIFNGYGWGWAYFNIHSYHGWNPDYDNRYSTDIKTDWQSHYVGENSPRWDTLKKMFQLQ